ncbi:Glycosyl transferase, family 39 [Trichormus variabilis ATCC 29413]|uniref:Glycosyl transferase, family 39 n=2 Tax=Anabaena variabilis TaxID=264691 RepID=Q3M8F7_TRIV2|nr:MULTISPECIES: glycosyltransferase family 39 protein [Nostocaceae]ABA22729.1 Glycosyl transferase, family 39 [Trichormus variabilis ATCC 29413]MBC1215235.1 glycosyltransferase family 39 protein [Trichormus variabilis ARAD]MBC1255572.1 glycosyltransferase family 39 protein [Trichormus variabilis V5]MBC1267144.1 glycosyltransferase family 39 protein [Trichormus variabilis FSR]MBC1303828.1 glycosyltransferase family 39 protein [Trichormus variabilis N2B]
MQEGSFIWGHLERQHRAVDKWIDRLWLVVLLIAALLLFSVNLGGLPLQDWDEGTIAQIAREITQESANSIRWLYPTLRGQPYHDTPPLMHIVIAGAYHLGGVNEWTTRLPGAILTALSVPLLYCLGREIFRQRWAAIYSALIYLTMLPVVRYGRLAMLEGAVVSFLLVMMLCVLRSRRDLRYCLGIGLSLGLICLTQGLSGFLLGAVVLVFLFWDTPRLLTSYYLWIAIAIGILPVAGWYSAQLLHYGNDFVQNGLLLQSLQQAGIVNHKNAQPSWFYIVELLKWTWPWLIFLPQTTKLLWENRNLSWARLILVWSIVYLLLISLMSVKLAWYIFPIYPSLALAFGAQLAEIENLPLLSSYPRAWVAGLSILAVVASAASIHFSWGIAAKTDLQLIFAAVALTMIMGAILAERGDGQFLKILFWGSYISLLLLMKSNYWVWELWQAYPVKPVAAMIEKVNPAAKKIYTSFPYHRPSLDFYSDRHIIPASAEELKHHWHYDRQPYLLISSSDFQRLQLDSVQILDKTEGWQLITKETNRL